MTTNQVPFRPALEGRFATRFFKVARGVATTTPKEAGEALHAAFKREMSWLEKQNKSVNPVQRSIYKAVWLLLLDLEVVGWTFSWSKNTLLLSKPRSNQPASSPDAVRAQKAVVRAAMKNARENRFEKYRDFIERMIAGNGSGTKKPITSLIGNGEEIAAKLLSARRSRTPEKRERLVSESVSPYLQLVNSKDVCEFTGQKLSDIWRFFRFTWSNPPETTPGRTMLYLVRDAAQTNHPIMAIFSLENAALRIGCRDVELGWDPMWFRKLVLACRTDKQRRELLSFLTSSIDRGISEIDTSELTTKRLIKKPTSEEVKRLAEVARRADAKRMAALKRWEARSENTRQKQSDLGGISVAAEKALYRRKRAESLSRLLSAKLTIQTALNGNDLSEASERLTKTDQGLAAVRAALVANKNQHVGTSILELNVCGAVPPYNHILSGKLAALLALSPKVVADYRERYGKRASDIASRMKGMEVVRPAELVFVGTTSLYGAGSSQYNRLKIPASVFGSTRDVRWRRLGATEGYGTLHISSETLLALEEVVKALGQSIRANHIFGEGASPKFRSIRSGIEAILEPRQRPTADQIGKHEMRRLVYGAELADNCQAVLTGQESKPKYYFRRTRNPANGTERIVDYWIERWLSSRINYLPALKAVNRFEGEEWLAEVFEAIEIESVLKHESLQEA